MIRRKTLTCRRIGDFYDCPQICVVGAVAVKNALKNFVRYEVGNRHSDGDRNNNLQRRFLFPKDKENQNYGQNNFHEDIGLHQIREIDEKQIEKRMSPLMVYF